MPTGPAENKSGRGAKGVFAVVIPLYNHGPMIEDVVIDALKLGLPVIVVDDGSTDSGPERIKHLDGIHFLQHRENLGKGAAIMTGFDRAAEIADWAITIDADGQHQPRQCDAGRDVPVPHQGRYQRTITPFDERLEVLAEAFLEPNQGAEPAWRSTAHMRKVRRQDKQSFEQRDQQDGDDDGGDVRVEGAGFVG